MGERYRRVGKGRKKRKLTGGRRHHRVIGGRRKRRHVESPFVEICIGAAHSKVVERHRMKLLANWIPN